MNSVVQYYKQIAEKAFADNPWLLQMQTQALQDLESLNFPDRHNEDWKYSPLDEFIKHKFKVKKTGKHAFEVIATGRQIDAPIGIKIPYVNGEVIGLADIQAKFPPGVIIETITNALLKYPDIVKQYLNKVLVSSHGMHALNSAMLKYGLFIYVPQNVNLPEPILLTHVNTEDNTAVFLRHLIVAEQGSLVKIIEDYQGTQEDNYFTNVITEIVLGENANVEHYKVQREGLRSFHFGHVEVNQLANSQFVSHLLNIGGHWSRSDISVNLIAKNAKCILNGVYMPINEQHMDHKTYVNHAVANCYSEQDYRGIAADKAQAVFNGKIYVAKDAVATEARQQNKNLLLSNLAQIYTKPQLEIFADDVVCTHGATVGQLDENALFYFASRGIAELEAKRYLLHAFADNNITKVEDKALSNWMRSLLEQQMR